MPILERIAQPIGASGYPLMGSQSWNSDEYNVDLSTPQNAAQTYDMMYRSDPKVRASANNLTWVLRSSQWRIDAAEQDPEGDEIAEFVRSVLMPGETYGYAGLSSWQQTLAAALLAPIYGYSVLEKILGWRERDGKQVYAAIELRHPKSIRHWNLTERGPSRLESITQWVQMRDGSAKDATIPADRAIVCSFGRVGDNYWGESILRPAHWHWRRKRDLLKFDATQKERMGGLFWVTSKEGVSPTDDQIAKAKAVLQNFRIHEKQGLYFPYVFDFHAEFPDNTAGDFITSVRYDDEQIEQSMMSAFQSLGTGEKGARSVGDIQLDFMLMAFQGVAKGLEDDFGQQAIVPLVDLNYGPREFYPRLACENFLQMKPDRLSTVIKPLVEAGIVRIDKPLRVLFREKLALPAEDESTMEPTPAEMAAEAAALKEKEDAAGPPKEGEQAGTRSTKARIRKAAYADTMPFLEGGLPLRRAAMPHEAHVDFRSMQRYLDQEPMRIWYRDVLPIREEQINTLASAASRATEAQLATGQIGQPNLKELGDAIGHALLGSYVAGRREVVAEALRSRLKVFTKVDDLEDDEDEFTIEPTKKQSTWIKRLGQAAALGMTLTLIKEAVRAGQAGQDQELPPVEIRAQVRRALEEMSAPVQQADLSGKVVQAFTTGRVEQGAAMAEEITSVFYSAILDSGTCNPCAAMDGEELDRDGYQSLVPNPNCEGGDRCRCQPVFVFRPQQRREAA